MHLEARKQNLIKAVMKVESEAVLAKLETVLKGNEAKTKKKPGISEFVGIISQSEADEMMKAIADTCETIDLNDWQ
jgi:hypothetical protein